MIVRDLEIEMPSFRRHSSRIDTLQLKADIVRKIGRYRADKYFCCLNRLLNLKLSKSNFDKLCISAIGRENVSLHNQLIRSILKNACVGRSPQPKLRDVEGSLDVNNANGYQGSFLELLMGDVLPPSPSEGMSPDLGDQNFRDCSSPIGTQSKIESMICAESDHITHEQQSATEMVSLGSRPPVEGVSVEDGEEVEQIMGTPSVQSRSPVRAPLGISVNNVGGANKSIRSNFLSASHPENCCNSYELPDSWTLKKRLEQKLESQGLGISMASVNLLNNGLDVFLKRLIKPCIELGKSRIGCGYSTQLNSQVTPRVRLERTTQLYSASLLDFRVAMELNPLLLGQDWPEQLERICLRINELENP